jgi:Fe-S oxidoreductase
MAETMKLCVSCKACRRECPTGVDMARMKIEVSAARIAKHGLTLRDRLVGYLPHYAPIASRLSWLVNLRNASPYLMQWSEKVTGFSGRRMLPRWRSDWFRDPRASSWPGLARWSSTSLPPPSQGVDARLKAGHDGGKNIREVVLFADTFNRYFEPDNVRAARDVLSAAGRTVHLVKPLDGERRPLCCGRTFLSVGLVAQAREEAQRCVSALAPFARRGVPILGLEPSCILGFRDEIPALIKSDDARALAAHALLFEEYIARETDAGRFALPLKPVGKQALLHGHCHQKSFAVMGAVEATLKLIPELKVETVDSSCCGMAGAFGYGAETYDASQAMAELSLLPAVRKAADDTIVVADGTSCRHQIKDGTGREPLHVARVLAMSLAPR